MIPFVKAHGCGNDFLIVDASLAEGRYGEITQKLCERNTGVGADGVEYLSRDADGEWAIRLFNADGNEGEISGNGTRCVAAWLASQREDLRQVSIHTLAGVRHCRIVQRDHPRYLITADMGIPAIEPKIVRLADGTTVAGYDVSMGVPHFATFVDNPNFDCHGRPWREIGAELCVHPGFPAGANINFVRVLSPDTIEFRIYERGVGPTQSSGTGSSASAVASMTARGTNRVLTVISEGGVQTVDWPDANSALVLTGPAEIVARGESTLV